MRYIVLSIAALFVVLTLSARSSAGTPGKVRVVTTLVTPVSGFVTCPVTVVFKATLTAYGFSPTKNHQVRYQWQRSPSGAGPTRKAVWSRPNVNVTLYESDNWTINRNGTYWERAMVIAPYPAYSDPVPFTINCLLKRGPYHPSLKR